MEVKTVEGYRKLKPYQRDALKFIIQRRGRAGVFMAPGTGKTILSIRYAKSFKRVLIICRRDDFLTWESELEREGEDASRIHRIESPRDWKKMPAETKWLMLTYGRARSSKDQAIKFDANCLITDESQFIKRWKAAQTKAVVKISQQIPRRLVLSGTPLTNDAWEDIWSQAMVIDGGHTFGTNWWSFMNRFFIKLRPPAPPMWVVKNESHRIIPRLLSTIAFHVHEDDVLKLPPVRRLMKSVEMTPEQSRRAKKVIEEWEYEFKGGSFDIDHVIVKLSKLRHIAGGFVYPPKVEGKARGKPEYLKCSKMALLADLIKNELARKKKIVVWAAFTAEIDKISETLGRMKVGNVRFYGKEKDQKDEARRQFRDNPRIRVFVGQADSGIGMNELIVADTAIYYSHSDRVMSRLQSERRIRRIGSEKHRSITYYDLVTEGSPDLKSLESVRQKTDLADFILKQLRLGKRPKDLFK